MTPKPAKKFPGTLFFSIVLLMGSGFAYLLLVKPIIRDHFSPRLAGRSVSGRFERGKAPLKQ
ncbi:MAG: hypothetical protein WCP06_06110 [Verrucomicrobiota bacterium]